MAVVNGTGQWVQKRVHKITWAALANGDSGSVYNLTRAGDKTVQVKGTFGAGGTVILEGTNDGGTTYFPLVDPQGNAISFTTAGGETLLETPEGIRPRVTAGDGTTALTVVIVSRAN